MCALLALFEHDPAGGLSTRLLFVVNNGDVVLRGAPQTYFDVYEDTFDYLREHEPMGLLHVAFHSHFGGRPLMTAMFDKLLAFLSAQPDVHFPGHNAIAKWVLERGDDDLSYAKRFFA